AAELGLEPAKLPVRRTEVVAPLGDAVRLVDDDDRDARAREEVPEAALESLRRDVHELVLARVEAPEAIAARLPVEARVDDGGAEAVPPESLHRGLHE